MAKTTPEEIQREVERLQNRYQFRFAGHPRATRDLAEMNTLIEEAETLLKKTRSLPRRAAEELRGTIKERIEFYKQEQARIQEVQDKGPDFRHMTELGTAANTVMHRYRRHFAGRDRSTRDLGLIDEMIRDLEGIQGAMRALEAKGFSDETLTNDQKVVAENLTLYTSERAEIARAREDGTIADRANRLANLANGQFAVYRVHFANRKRVSRRTNLLKRIIKQLESIQQTMIDLRDGHNYSDSTHANNLGIVTERLGVYRSELTQIEDAKRATSTIDLVYALGESANNAMADYGKEFAGQNRATRNLDLLNEICDRLGETERQMNAVVQEHGDITANTRNLRIVRDTLRKYEREYDQIVQAKEDEAKQLN